MSPNARSSPDVIWWVYVMLCERDILYVGISPDPIRRFLDHQKRKSRFSRMRRPVELLASHPWGPHAVAAAEEYRLKQQSRQRKLEWVGMIQRSQAWQQLIVVHGTGALIAQRAK